jgi:hypothetical protein
MATSLMPVNPPAGQQQVARILPIRANLMPTEITAGRNARRMRVIVIALVATVAVALGGWYYSALQDKAAAVAENDAVNQKIHDAHDALNQKNLAAITTTVTKTDALAKQLKSVTADDLPWSTLLNRLRAVGTSKDLSIAGITASVSAKQTTAANSLPTTTTETTVGTLSITGLAKDKNTIALLIEKLPSVNGVADPYLTTATQSSGKLSFTITADLTSKVLCGRYSGISCKTGGK